jgi:hypothetical protein
MVMIPLVSVLTTTVRPNMPVNTTPTSVCSLVAPCRDRRLRLRLGVMESTELHEELAISFPSIWPQLPSWTWVNVHDGRDLKIDILSELVQRLSAGFARLLSAGHLRRYAA